MSRNQSSIIRLITFILGCLLLFNLVACDNSDSSTEESAIGAGKQDSLAPSKYKMNGTMLGCDQSIEGQFVYNQQAVGYALNVMSGQTHLITFKGNYAANKGAGITLLRGDSVIGSDSRSDSNTISVKYTAPDSDDIVIVVYPLVRDNEAIGTFNVKIKCSSPIMSDTALGGNCTSNSQCQKYAHPDPSAGQIQQVCVGGQCVDPWKTSTCEGNGGMCIFNYNSRCGNMSYPVNEATRTCGKTYGMTCCVPNEIQ